MHSDVSKNIEEAVIQGNCDIATKCSCHFERNSIVTVILDNIFNVTHFPTQN